MTETITIQVRGKTLADFLRVAVTSSAVEPYSVCAITSADDATGTFANMLQPEHQLTIMAGRDLVLTGFIDYCEPSYDGTEHKVEARGRSTGALIHDHDATHPTREFRGRTILDIANALNPGMVTFTTNLALAPIDLFRLNPGETVHAALLRLCQKQHLQLMGLPDGSIRITDGAQATSGPVTILRDYGDAANVIRASAVFDATPKKTAYHVQGQRSLGRASLSSIRVGATANTGKIVRRRERTHFADAGMDDADASTHSQSLRDRHLGGTTTATMTVWGWRDASGALWRPNTLVTVDSPKLKLQRPMVIREVAFTQDRAGTQTQLTLGDPAALKKGAQSKANDLFVTPKLAN